MQIGQAVQILIAINEIHSPALPIGMRGTLVEQRKRDAMFCVAFRKPFTDARGVTWQWEKEDGEDHHFARCWFHENELALVDDSLVKPAPPPEPVIRGDEENQRHHTQMRGWAKGVADYLLSAMGVQVDGEILVATAYADYQPRMEEPWHIEDYMRYVLYVQRAYEALGGQIVDMGAHPPQPVKAAAETPYSAFERGVIRLYDAGALTIPLLDALAEVGRGIVMDSGGDNTRRASDGLDLMNICIEILDPCWRSLALAPAFRAEETWDKWEGITHERWGWQ